MPDVDAGSAADSPTRLDFRLLGSLEIECAGRAIEFRGHRVRVVLTMLLLAPDRVVTVDSLINAVWGGAPPRTATTQVHICVSKIRRRFSQEDCENVIHTHSAGYRIEGSAVRVDALLFDEHLRRARTLAAQRDLTAASSAYRTAIGLWRGPVGEGLSGAIDRYAVDLHHQRDAAQQEWVDVDFALGRHADHIGRLRALATEHPTREHLHARLAIALYREGRQAEALDVCHSARHMLVHQYGIDPGGELSRAEHTILQQVDDDLVAHSADVLAPDLAPRQLPPAPVWLVARDAELDGIVRHLRESAPTVTGPRVVMIAGAPGVGKSSLAVLAAQQVATDYGDGHLYACLRDGDGRPAAPHDVLRKFLVALGWRSPDYPAELDELSALFRSLVAGQRLLILLDDVDGASQVTPLLPGHSGAAVVMTGRRHHGYLPITHGVDLGLLNPDSSVELLERSMGHRGGVDRAAYAELADLCGHLPLALRVAAARLENRHHWSVGDLVRRLDDESRRLDELAIDGACVRTSMSMSYAALGTMSRRLLVLAAALELSDFGGWMAGPLLDADPGTAAASLDDLVDARLVEIVAPGRSWALTRYRLHDLTQLFAAERMPSEITVEERRAGTVRSLWAVATLAWEARSTEYGADHGGVQPPAEELASGAVASARISDPLGWLLADQDILVQAVDIAADLGELDLCMTLTTAGVTAFEIQADFRAWRATNDRAAGLAADRRDRRAQALLSYSSGGLALAQKDLRTARRDLEWAGSIFVDVGDWHGRALVDRDLAVVDRLEGAPERARGRAMGALATLKTTGDLVAIANVLRTLARLDLDENRVDGALDRLWHALDLCTRAGARRVGTQVRFRLGHALLARGDHERAGALFDDVVEATRAGHDVIGQANALLGMGALHLTRHDLTRAEAEFGRAHELAKRSGVSHLEADIVASLGDVRLRSGDPAQAAEYLGSARAKYLAIGARGGVERVDRLLRSAEANASWPPVDRKAIAPR